MLETCTKTLMCKQPRHACLRCSCLKHEWLDLLCKRALRYYRSASMNLRCDSASCDTYWLDSESEPWVLDSTIGLIVGIGAFGSDCGSQ